VAVTINYLDLYLQNIKKVIAQTHIPGPDTDGSESIPYPLKYRGSRIALNVLAQKSGLITLGSRSEYDTGIGYKQNVLPTQHDISQITKKKIYTKSTNTISWISHLLAVQPIHLLLTTSSRGGVLC
jgi:hypothetical protein